MQWTTYIVDQQIHNSLWHYIFHWLVDNSQIWRHQWTYALDLTFKGWISLGNILVSLYKCTHIYTHMHQDNTIYRNKTLQMTRSILPIQDALNQQMHQTTLIKPYQTGIRWMAEHLIIIIVWLPHNSYNSHFPSIPELASWPLDSQSLRSANQWKLMVPCYPWTVLVIGVLLSRAWRPGICYLTVFATQHWVSTCLGISWRHTFLWNIDKTYSVH